MTSHTGLTEFRIDGGPTDNTPAQRHDARAYLARAGTGGVMTDPDCPGCDTTDLSPFDLCKSDDDPLCIARCCSRVHGHWAECGAA